MQTTRVGCRVGACRVDAPAPKVHRSSSNWCTSKLTGCAPKTSNPKGIVVRTHFQFQRRVGAHARGLAEKQATVMQTTDGLCGPLRKREMNTNTKTTMSKHVSSYRYRLIIVKEATPRSNRKANSGRDPATWPILHCDLTVLSGISEETEHPQFGRACRSTYNLSITY